VFAAAFHPGGTRLASAGPDQGDAGHYLAELIAAAS
jgi:hypothetical protein